ncbi:hypothetical protein Tco_1407054 [Tanacetum coccineum]
MAEPNLNDYASVTQKNFLSDDNEGKMVEKSFLKIQGIFLDRFRLSVFPISLTGAAGEWFKKYCIGSVTTWEDLVEKFIQKFYHLSYNNDEIEADEDNNPDDIAEIFKIKGNLFDFETPLCKAFNEFNYLLKIDTNLFTFDIQEIKTYELHKYELNNNMTGDLKEAWSDNGVPYQLCDHICEPYRFKNGKVKWPTCSVDIDGFCNDGELPRMVRVGCMTYFQDHQWYDELTEGVLKEEALMHKARFEGSWGYATPGVMKFCAWLKNSFESFHELDHDVLVKAGKEMQELVVAFWTISPAFPPLRFFRSVPLVVVEAISHNAKKFLIRLICIPMFGYRAWSNCAWCALMADGTHQSDIRRFLALGWLLEEIHVTWAHLEKIQTRLQTYTKSFKDLCKQWLKTASQTDMNDLESDDESVDTPLVSPFPHSDNDSDDGEVLNELSNKNVGMLRREKAINNFDGDDLAFQCMIGFRKFVAYFNPFLPINIITHKACNTIMVKGLESTGKNLVVIVRDVYVFIG